MAVMKVHTIARDAIVASNVSMLDVCWVYSRVLDFNQNLVLFRCPFLFISTETELILLAQPDCFEHCGLLVEPVYDGTRRADSDDELNLRFQVKFSRK